MPAKWMDVCLGFEFVSGDGGAGNEAFVSKATGQVYLRGDYADEKAEIPDDLDDADLYVALPTKRDLDLGGRLVDRFAEEIAPQHADDIRDVFSGKGAYRRLKSYLERRGLLERWYAFENAEEEMGLRKWCAENGIVLED
jgi:hypothetical protein